MVGLLGIAAYIGFSETTEREVALAEVLRTDIKKVLKEQQEAYYQVGHNTVTMNVYGVVDQNGQAQIEVALKSTLTQESFRGHVYLSFFSSREESGKHGTPEGWTVIEGKKGKLVRTIEIQ